MTTTAAAFFNSRCHVVQHNVDLLLIESHIVWKVLKKTQLYKEQHFCPTGRYFSYILDPLSIHAFENGFTDLETTLRNNRKHIFYLKPLVYSNEKHNNENRYFCTDVFANNFFNILRILLFLKTPYSPKTISITVKRYYISLKEENGPYCLGI